MQLGKLLLLVPLVGLTGCLPDSEFRGVPAGGGGFWDAWNGTPSRPAPVPAQQGYKGQPLAPGASKMLEDPEASESSTSEYVYAFTDQEATSLCQKIADRRGWRFDSMTPEKFVNNLGKRKYSCFWTIFGEPSYDNDRHR